MSPVEIGAVVEARGRTYTLIRREPYTRKSDGGASELLTWQATCAICGQPFETKSGPEPKYSGLGDRINCPEHKGQMTAEARERSQKAWIAYVRSPEGRARARERALNPTPAMHRAQQAWGARMSTLAKERARKRRGL